MNYDLSDYKTSKVRIIHKLRRCKQSEEEAVGQYDTGRLSLHLTRSAEAIRERHQNRRSTDLGSFTFEVGLPDFRSCTPCQTGCNTSPYIFENALALPALFLPLAVRSKAWVWGRSPAEIVGFDAGKLARSQYPEGPVTGHLDTGFS